MFPDAAWRVKIGTGMGLTFSGDLSDITFYFLSEHLFMTSLEVQRRFNIEIYVRFKDDLLFIAHPSESDPDLMLNFVEEVRRRSRDFRLKCEGISCASMSYLDLMLSFSTVGDRVIVKWGPYSKPTSLNRLLSHRSSHPLQIHVSWPFNELRRLARQCRGFVQYSRVREQFVDRFRQTYAPSALVRQLSTFCPPIGRHSHQYRNRTDQNVLWLVLPFHKAWETAGISSSLRNFTTSPLSVEAWRSWTGKMPPDVRVAWRNTLPLTHKSVRQAHFSW